MHYIQSGKCHHNIECGSSSILRFACLSVCVEGAVVLQISCFSEAERIYMLAKDTSVSNQQLTSLVLPEIMVMLRQCDVNKPRSQLNV